MAKVTDHKEDRKRKILLRTIVSDLLETSSESDDEIYQILAEDSDSEEDAVLERLVKRCRTTNIRKDYMKLLLPDYSSEEFMKEYAISKDLFNKLVSIYEESDAYAYLRPDKRLSAALNMSAFLWFAGRDGCTFADVSQRFDLPKSSVSRVIYRITTFLHSMKDEYIKWPTAEEKQKSANVFERKFGFSKAMGCIDVTQVGVDTYVTSKPPSNDMNQKGNPTVCVQAVCDDQNRFIDIHVNYPGSTHPNQILYSSQLYENISTLCEDYYLLGSSCYACSDWIITPYNKSEGSKGYTKYFNAQHNRAHDLIKCSFSILKQRFKQLHYCKLKTIERLCNFVEACCILHNMSIGDDYPITNMTDDGVDGENIEPDINDQTRTLICEELWRKKS